MSLRPLRCSIALLLMLSACATRPDLDEDNRVPTDYKAEIAAYLRTYLNDPTNLRDAAASQPVLLPFGPRHRYIVCLRFNAKNSDGRYPGLVDSAAIFYAGRLYRFIELTPDETAADAALRDQVRNGCKTATYQPFPEIEHLAR